MSTWEFLITATLALSGWFYSSFISAKASKRSEVRNVCDQIENLLKDVYKLAHQLNDQKIDPLIAELQCTQVVTLVEMKHRSLKRQTNQDFFDLNDLAGLLFKLAKKESPELFKLYELEEVGNDCADIIESAEQAYSNLYSPRFNNGTSDTFCKLRMTSIYIFILPSSFVDCLLAMPFLISWSSLASSVYY